MQEEEEDSMANDEYSVIKQVGKDEDDPEDDDNECLSVEGEESSIFSQDDYYNMNHFLNENNELSWKKRTRSWRGNWPTRNIPHRIVT